MRRLPCHDGYCLVSPSSAVLGAAAGRVLHAAAMAAVVVVVVACAGIEPAVDGDFPRSGVGTEQSAPAAERASAQPDAPSTVADGLSAGADDRQGPIVGQPSEDRIDRREPPDAAGLRIPAPVLPSPPTPAASERQAAVASATTGPAADVSVRTPRPDPGGADSPVLVLPSAPDPGRGASVHAERPAAASLPVVTAERVAEPGPTGGRDSAPPTPAAENAAAAEDSAGADSAAGPHALSAADYAAVTDVAHATDVAHVTDVAHTADYAAATVPADALSLTESHAAAAVPSPVAVARAPVTDAARAGTTPAAIEPRLSVQPPPDSAVTRTAVPFDSGAAAERQGGLALGADRRSASRPAPAVVERTLGFSHQGRSITSTRFGNGPQRLVIFGAIHGDYERNTGRLMERLIQRLRELVVASPTAFPAAWTVDIVPWLNPDGLKRRENAAGVDLNRNWPTADWVSDVPGLWSVLRGVGGEAPFSEPETRIARDHLLSYRDDAATDTLLVIFYHALRAREGPPEAGLVMPAYTDTNQTLPTAENFARVAAEILGYEYLARWNGGYPTPGEAVHWAGNQGIAAVDIELPDPQPPDFRDAAGISHEERHFGLLMAILAHQRWDSP